MHFKINLGYRLLPLNLFFDIRVLPLPEWTGREKAVEDTVSMHLRILLLHSPIIEEVNAWSESCQYATERK